MVCNYSGKVSLYHQPTNRTLEEERRENPQNIIEEDCPICEDFLAIQSNDRNFRSLSSRSEK